MERIVLDKDAKTYLDKFWKRHAKLRRKCFLKYGYDPLKDEKYWDVGLLETEHRRTLFFVRQNYNILSLVLAKKWARTELRVDKLRSRSRSRSSIQRKSRSVSKRGLSGGYTYKGINPETGGVVEFLLSVPARVASTIDSSGKLVAKVLSS